MLRSTLVPFAVLVAACRSDDTPSDGPTGTTDPTPTDGKQRVTILHTNDWQSHMLGWGPNAEYTPATQGDDSTVGGLARVKTLVDDIRSSTDHPVVLYDGGDWMAGDLFQLLATTDAAELQAMGALGYDAITFGNHEFDWGPDVLGRMITIAGEHGVDVPIVASNTTPSPTDPADDLLEAHFASGRVRSTLVQELDNGLRIGLLGLLGDQAASISPAAVPTTFVPAVEAATTAIAALEAEGVDLVVALTHNGVTDDPETSPDEILARDAVGIDVIVGGHSHTPLFEHRVAGDGTIIVQAGALTQYLGRVDLAWDGSTWQLEGYALTEIDDTIAGDADVTAQVDGFVDALETGPLVALGTTFAQPIASVPGDIVAVGCAEAGLGDLITDAYLYAMNAAGPADPVDFAYESQGVIRDNVSAGTTGIEGFSDVFRVLPLGGDAGDQAGYPLVDFYVEASDVKGVCEVTASISPIYGCDYFVELAGMRCTVDMGLLPFSRTRLVERWNGTGWEPLDTSAANTELYHVAVDSYVASLMYTLEELTSGLIVITPRDAAGNPIGDLTTAVFDANPATPAVEPLKLWQALASYLGSFPDTTGDGVPDVPASYLSGAGRIIGYDE